MLPTLKPIQFSGITVAVPDGPEPAPHTGRPGFATLFDRAPLPMWIFDSETLRFLAVNEAAIQRYGWSRAEFLTMTADKVHPAAHVAAFLDFKRRHDASDVAAGDTANLRHTTKSGEIHPVQTTWQRITYEGRLAILATIVDRSGHQRAEEENRELAGILNLASDAIIVCDLDRRILFWNQGAERIYGWSAREALGKDVGGLLGIESDSILATTGSLLSRGAWNGEMKHTRKSGNPAIVNCRWTLAREENGGPESLLLISTDITETKRLESQFLRAQRLESLGTLASGIAHDLNNILSPILMATGILRTSNLDPEDAKMLAIIESSAERGAGIVKQVLTFARGAEGERVLLQPKHLVTEMAMVMNQTFPKNIAITTSIPADLWLLTGNATQIHQVLLNLCVNARDALGEAGGSLRIACENIEVDEHLARTNPGARTGPHVCFSVTDSGCGMTPDVMEKIFDPFFTTKEEGKGTGLGLATVIGIVQSHRGFLTVQSKPGVGTTFRVFLPASLDAREEKADPAGKEDLTGGGELVLVVDDEAPVREAIVATLDANGYRCYTAEDGTDALALYFERREIGIIVTDLHMSMMDGIALTRSLRRLNPAVKVIVSSGHVDKEKETVLQSLGVRHILEKPYTAEKLLRAIKELLHSGD